MTIIEYKKIDGELVRIKDRNHIYNNLEEFMTNVLTFMRYVDLLHSKVESRENECIQQGKNAEETWLAIDEITRSVMEEFNELSPWGMDHVDIVDQDSALYQKGYYFPTRNNDYPYFDSSHLTPYKYSTARLHAINIGIQIWNCEIEENEERGDYISYSLWRYIEDVKQGDLIEYRGWYMQVKDFTKQQ